MPDLISAATVFFIFFFLVPATTDEQCGDVPQHARPGGEGRKEGGRRRQAGENAFPRVVDGETDLPQVRRETSVEEDKVGVVLCVRMYVRPRGVRL